MKPEKHLPLLHTADRKLRRKLQLVAAGFGFIALVLILLEARYKLIGGAIGDETYRLVLQFFLITAGGGMLLAIVGNVRDQAGRLQARADAIQTLHRELDCAYRALKKTKRTLRGHRLHHLAEGGGATQRIPRPAFEKAMEDLLDAQLELETICEHIGQRGDILRGDRLERMRQPLRYFARYYHDVHEDFEKGPVRLEGDYYSIEDAANLNDFLRSRRDAPRSRPGEIEVRLREMKDVSANLSVRADALKAIVAVSPEENGGERGKVHYADVAGACYDLLSAELAQVRANLLA